METCCLCDGGQPERTGPETSWSPAARGGLGPVPEDAVSVGTDAPGRGLRGPCPGRTCATECGPRCCTASAGPVSPPGRASVCSLPRTLVMAFSLRGFDLESHHQIKVNASPLWGPQM